jgi:diadenosine tetraphosphatase ApaH/serine/threonine PP2A family protein phosphatase
LNARSATQTRRIASSLPDHFNQVAAPSPVTGRGAGHLLDGRQLCLACGTIPANRLGVTMKILVIADVHANLIALEAVLSAAPPVDLVWNLGDSVGYGPRPVETLARLATLQPEVSLAGNHDLAAIGRLNLADFNLLARAAARWTAAQLRPEDIDWLTSLPSSTTSRGMTLAHGSPRHPVWEYIISETIAAENFAYFDTSVCWIGHSHVPLIARQEKPELAEVRPFGNDERIDIAIGKWLLNPGSVGQPRDGDPRASYAILDTDRGVATNHRVAYDIERTQRQMAEAGLPAPLIERLRHGH